MRLIWNIERGAALIQGAADNIDIIEETSDGKETTHATSMVLYQHESVADDTNHELQDIDSPDFPVFDGHASEKPRPRFLGHLSNILPGW